MKQIRYTKEELTRKAAEIFKLYAADSDLVFATTDGFFFLKNNKPYAYAHARSIQSQVITITKSESETTTEDKSATSTKLQEQKSRRTRTKKTE